MSTLLKNETGPHEDGYFTVSTSLKNVTLPYDDDSFTM